jgi:hypothetical protein
MLKPKPNEYPFDLIIEKELTNSQLKTACAMIFDLHPNEFVVVNSLDELNTTEDNSEEQFTIEEFMNKVAENEGKVSPYNLIIVSEAIKGNFKTLIECIPHNHTNLKIDQIGDLNDIVQRFADVLGCKCLIRDNDNNGPTDDDYEEDKYVLFENNQPKKTVYINDTLLDHNFYVILREKGQDNFDK